MFKVCLCNATYRLQIRSSTVFSPKFKFTLNLCFIPDLCYNIALCYYKLKQYSASLKYITEIIERGIKEHPGKRKTLMSVATDEARIAHAFNLSPSSFALRTQCWSPDWRCWCTQCREHIGTYEESHCSTYDLNLLLLSVAASRHCSHRSVQFESSHWVSAEELWDIVTHSTL